MNAAEKAPPGFDTGRPFGSFVAATREVLLDPARFFAAVRREDSFAGPVIFAAVCQLLAVLLAGAYDFGRTAATGTLDGISVVGYEGAAGALLWVLWLLGISVPYALVTLLVGAGVYHLLVLLFVGRRNAGFGATLRVTGYLSAVSLLLWLPVLGLLAGLWGVWINVAGLKELHSTTTTRAVLVAVVPYLFATAWAVFWVASGQSTPAEFVFGGGTMFPRGDALS